MSIEFQGWPKIARLDNETMVVTEKLDGTNACIQFQPPLPLVTTDGYPYVFACQSRTRLITPGDDNYGFATWVYANVDSLFRDLGYGTHFGEWFGAGIQRKYGLAEKHFALFNTHLWNDKRGTFETPNLDVVPLLYTGPVDAALVKGFAADLSRFGSRMVPGWDKPEGVVAYLTASRVSWKVTDAKAGPGKHA